MNLVIEWFVVLIASASIGGGIGGFLAYLIMYKAWRTDRNNFFDRLNRKNGIK